MEPETPPQSPQNAKPQAATTLQQQSAPQSLASPSSAQQSPAPQLLTSSPSALEPPAPQSLASPSSTPELSVLKPLVLPPPASQSLASPLSAQQPPATKQLHYPNEHNPVLQARMQQLYLCVVIPTYNNQKTLADVIHDVLQYTSNVIVVNDGSTDQTAKILNAVSAAPATFAATPAATPAFSASDIASAATNAALTPPAAAANAALTPPAASASAAPTVPIAPTPPTLGIRVVSYMPNRGKGYALKKGFDEAKRLGYKGAITIDSDGQHFASEIERFVDYAEKHPDALLLGQRTTEGDMPAKNSFANKFSNFWFTVQTAYRLNDTQNGFRLYPLAAMKGLRPVSSRYEAELETLVRAAWKGIRIIPVPTRVYYPPEGERVTHFRPGKDFFRISVLNTLFTLLAIVYGYPSMFLHTLFAKKKKS